MKTNDLHLSMDTKNIDTKIDQFVPKREMRQQIEFVSDFFFAIFYGFNEQNRLVNNN